MPSPSVKQPEEAGVSTSPEAVPSQNTKGICTTNGIANMDEIFQGLEQTLMAAVETMVKQACEQMKFLLLEEIAKVQVQVQKLQEQVSQIRNKPARPNAIQPSPNVPTMPTIGDNAINVQIDTLTAAVNNQQRVMEQQARLIRRQNAVLVGLEENNENENTKEKVTELLRTKMRVEEPRVETAFRLGRKQDENTSNSRPILIRFQTVEGKEVAMKKKMSLKDLQGSRNVRDRA